MSDLNIRGYPRALSRLLERGKVRAARIFFREYFWTQEELDQAKKGAAEMMKELFEEADSEQV